MKSLFKMTMLATTMAFTLNAASVFAAETAKTTEATAPAPKEVAKEAVKEAADALNSNFKSSEEQSSYALGASLGRYMENLLKEQEKVGLSLNRDQLLVGVEDAFNSKSKLSDAEIEKTLQAFEVKAKAAAQVKAEKEAKESTEKGDKFREAFAKEAGVKKTESGLLFRVDKEGTGASPKATDTVVVNYKGRLIDGTEFDNSYTRGEPLSFRVDGVIPGWTEGLQHVKKGGKITLVIPPELGYGKTAVPGIPANSTLIFEVELVDIKDAAKEKEESKAGEPAEHKTEKQSHAASEPAKKAE